MAQTKRSYQIIAANLFVIGKTLANMFMEYTGKMMLAVCDRGRYNVTVNGDIENF